MSHDYASGAHSETELGTMSVCKTCSRLLEGRKGENQHFLGCIQG